MDHSLFMSSSRPAVARDPIALVVTECITVTSAMRKHARFSYSSVASILSGGSSLGKRDLTGRSSLGEGTGKAKARHSVSGPPSTEEDGTLSSRWGLRGKRGKSMEDNPLMAAFARLRADLKLCKDISTFDTPTLLHPFLQVIRASATSAPITSLALIAVTKFFGYRNIINKDSPRLAIAMQLLSAAITHCRFEPMDATTNEIVMLRVLKLMEGMIAGPGGAILGDDSVWEMMQTGLGMCCQLTLSELFRRCAEISMVTICQVIFERLKHLDPKEGEELQIMEKESKIPTAEEKTTTNGDSRLPSAPERTLEGRSSNSLDHGPGPDDSRTSLTLNSSEVHLPPTSDPDQEIAIKPYSLPSIRELFRILVDLLDPHDRQHTDTMRVMALRIVDVALEVAGPSIANHPSLALLAKDTLCRHLFQLVRSENIAILNESLRVAGTLLATCRNVLKLQQELFLSYLVACLHPRVEIPQEPGIDPALYEGVPQAPRLVKPVPSQSSSGRSTPVPVKDRQRLGMEGGMRKPDAREAMVESLGGLGRIPSFMVELFVNYDCEIDRSDLCQDMVGLLSRNAFPDSATWSTTNVPPLCLDSLLGYVQFIAERLEDEPRRDGFPKPRLLREQRARKSIIIKGATKFNQSPTAGLSFLAAEGIIENIEDPHCVAEFLKGTTRLDKKVLGDFLSKKANEELLGAFLDQFQFSCLRVDEALRELLYFFRLPGESQLIERIIARFSQKYCGRGLPEGIADENAVYVLTYAIIMLNTDQHNPNVKDQNRMSFTDFSRNLRGVNGNNDFHSDYLQEIYSSIKSREIILPEEHDNKHSFDYAWKELLMKSQSSIDLVICDTNIFDADMFATTWKPIVATMTYVFMSATDDAVFSRVVTGFDQCAHIAAKYGLTDVVDHIIFCLSSISTLASESPPSTALNTEVQAGGNSIMVSETAVRFGRDFKAQLATVILFRVLNGHESAVRDGWIYIVRILLTLFSNSLILPAVSSTSRRLDLPPIPLQSPVQVVEHGEKANEAGLFSAFTSYVSSLTNDEPPEPSDQEIEYTLCTIDCVNACSLEDILSNISRMPNTSLQALLRLLLAQLPEETSPRISVDRDVQAPTPLRANGHRAKSGGSAYNPTVVYILELATILATRDAETVKQLGKDVADALQGVVRHAKELHPVIVSRTMYYLLNLLMASNDYDFLRAPVVLHAIFTLGEDLLRQSGPYVLKGVMECIKGPQALRNEMTNSPDFWSILNALHSIPEAAPTVFDIVEEVVTGSPSALSADNYEAAVGLLNGFAGAASIGAIQEQARDQEGRKAKAGRDGKEAKPAFAHDAVARGTKALSIVFSLTERVQFFIAQSHLEPSEAWLAYWSPILRTFTAQGINPCRSIRHTSLALLQRCLLSALLISSFPLPRTGESISNPSAAQNGTEHRVAPALRISETIFGMVLFPLVTRLLKQEVYVSDPAGMNETRVQAAALLCKVFLSRMEDMRGLDGQWGLVGVWTGILGVCERLIKSGVGGNEMEEQIPESLKNILLVMSNSGYLIPSDQRGSDEGADEQLKGLQTELWDETWSRLERFMPLLMAELFPEEVDKQKAPKGKSGDKVQRKDQT